MLALEQMISQVGAMTRNIVDHGLANGINWVRKPTPKPSVASNLGKKVPPQLQPPRQITEKIIICWFWQPRISQKMSKGMSRSHGPNA